MLFNGDSEIGVPASSEVPLECAMGGLAGSDPPPPPPPLDTEPAADIEEAELLLSLEEGVKDEHEALLVNLILGGIEGLVVVVLGAATGRSSFSAEIPGFGDTISGFIISVSGLSVACNSGLAAIPGFGAWILGF